VIRAGTCRAFDLRPLGNGLGAEVLGAPAPDRLHRTDVEDLRDAVLEHRVLILRGAHLDQDAHARLARRFGAVRPGRATPAPRWVAAGSTETAPPKILTFRAVDPAGHRVHFADAVRAYRLLPAPLRAAADRSWAVHHVDENADGTDGVAHPVTRLHTETGDRALLLGEGARRILGMDATDSRTLLDLLQSSLVRPDNIATWAGAVGDAVLADACAVQHRAENAAGADPGGIARIDVAGNAPLGVNGQHSHRLGPWGWAERSSARTGSTGRAATLVVDTTHPPLAHHTPLAQTY
jgi:alpha-ketoglutarate-dependent sulfate ester dioxygenase